MPIKRLAGVTKALRILFLAYLGVTVLMIVASISVLVDYSDQRGSDYVFEIGGPVVFESVVGVLSIPVVIAVTVVYLVWSFRLSTNLHLLSGRRMKYSPGWSVGWWFIPFASLVMPYRVMREMWHAIHGTDHRGHATVKWWWAAWLVSNLISSLTWRVGIDQLTVDDYVSGSFTGVVVGILDVLSVVATLVLLDRVTGAYARRIAEPADGWVRLSTPAVGGAYGPGIAYGPGAAYGDGSGYGQARGPVSWPVSAPPPGWYADPSGRHQLRFWDAVYWSPYVLDDGVQALDPV